VQLGRNRSRDFLLKRPGSGGKEISIRPTGRLKGIRYMRLQPLKETFMPVLVRPRGQGRTFELRIIHRQLQKAFYRNFDTEESAHKFGALAVSMLDSGMVPDFLVAKPRQEFNTIAGAIRIYEERNGVPSSTANVLATVRADIGQTKLSEVNYLWAEKWVREQKITQLRAPGTIRHNVGALARCLDWVTNAYPQYLVQNPLRKLPRGYAVCNKKEAAELRSRGHDVKADVERDRRIAPAEHQRILDVFDKRAARETDPARRHWHQSARLMYELACETAMRMRELYTLEKRRKQIDLDRRTVFLNRTKNGDRREIPLSSVALALLREPLTQQDLAVSGELLFPFWDGNLDPDALDATSAKMSAYFAGVFAEALCLDLGFHDTRHEAICQFVLRTSWDAVRLARVTGHRDPRCLRRYMSLRGSELADDLW
jgi:integrase